MEGRIVNGSEFRYGSEAASDHITWLRSDVRQAMEVEKRPVGSESKQKQK